MIVAVALLHGACVFPQTHDTTRLTATVLASPRVYTGTDTAGAGVLGRASLEVHPLQPVVDDEAPLELQPFLQRVSSVGVWANASSDRIRNAQTVLARDGGFGVAADFTLRRVLVLGASVGWGRATVDENRPPPRWTRPRRSRRAPSRSPSRPACASPTCAST